MDVMKRRQASMALLILQQLDPPVDQQWINMAAITVQRMTCWYGVFSKAIENDSGLTFGKIIICILMLMLLCFYFCLQITAQVNLDYIRCTPSI